MRASDIIRRASRSLLSARIRTILTAFAIAVGAFALTLTLAASNGAKHYADTIIKDNFDPSELIVTNDASLFSTSDPSTPQEYDPSFGSITAASGASRQIKMLTDSDITRLRQTPGVAQVRPAITVDLQYLTRDGQRSYVATLSAYDAYRNPTLLAGTIPATIANGSIILPEGFVSALGFSSPKDAVGKVVRLAIRQQINQQAVLSSLLSGDSSGLKQLGQTTTTEQKFTVIAVAKKPSTLIQPATGLYLYANDHDVSQLNDITTQGSSSYHKYLSAYVKVRGGNDAATLKSVQNTIKGHGYGAQSVLDTEKIISQVITVLQGIVSVFGLIAVVASIFGIINTMYISVLQRTREIGLMKALGMHKRDINRLFLFEAALIGFLGGVLGAIAGVLASIAVNPALSKQLDIGSSRLLIINPLQLVFLVLALVIVAIAAGLLPARKAAKLDPITALRTE